MLHKRNLVFKGTSLECQLKESDFRERASWPRTEDPYQLTYRITGMVLADLRLHETLSLKRFEAGIETRRFNSGTRTVEGKRHYLQEEDFLRNYLCDMEAAAAMLSADPEIKLVGPWIKLIFEAEEGILELSIQALPELLMEIAVPFGRELDAETCIPNSCRTYLDHFLKTFCIDAPNGGIEVEKWKQILQMIGEWCRRNRELWVDMDVYYNEQGETVTFDIEHW